MPRKRQLVKTLQQTFKQIGKKLFSTINKKIIWLLRTIFITNRRPGGVNSGFVLPTVAMVILVVVLLTTAILFRSFERSKNASNVRVNEAVLNAAAPAIDRARAKLDALLEDPTLPRGTPSDSALYEVLKKDKYRLGDETRLKLALEFNGITGIQTGDINNNGTPTDTSDDFVNEDETLKTAWKFAVDTDNNGLKDTFTLYGIYFRTPPRNSTGLFSRERKALEARTPPMDSSTNQSCATATGFASLVGNSSWYKLNSGNLGKSFFVYTVNVPITKQIYDTLPTTTTPIINQNNSEYKGNKSVVALEFQQDRTRIPLANNAVWFQNDLEVIVSSTTLFFNGRVHTNGNFLVAVVDAVGANDGNIKFRQVSSKTSCFYNEENGLISVGGNVGNGSLSQVGDKNVVVDLYRGFGNPITTGNIEGGTSTSNNKSTNSTAGGSEIGFNDTAYNQRIAAMKNTAIALCTTCDAATTGTALKTAVNAISYPQDVKSNVQSKVQNTDDGDTAREIFYNEIEIYLRNRTRQVPFVEVPGSAGTVGATDSYSAIGADLKPQADWRKPIATGNQLTGTTAATATINASKLKGTYPTVQKQEAVQTELGDRILVGNNLPALWLQNDADTEYVGSATNQLIVDSSGTSVSWDRPSGAPQKWRNTQVQAIADLGISDRNGFWEESAATNPLNDLDSTGGVRIVTGAGIYVDDPDIDGTTTNAFYDRPTLSILPNPPDPTPSDTTDIPVWPDTMPMSDPLQANKTGDLLMRATAVYHYKIENGTAQKPIACVSSYYNPSDQNTSKNKTGLTVPPTSGGTPTTVNLPWNSVTNGKSNNGIVYNYPTAGRSTFFNTHKDRLQRQANLKFPNGRWANEPLQNAIDNLKAKNSGTLPTTVPTSGLQLADYSAIDTALCAISILSNEAGFVATPTNQPTHGAIKEATFLDAREARQISASSTSTDYNLDLEQRQPSEIRVTDIDLGLLATTALTSGSGASLTTNEYLLPYSGIIYATREDALRDESVPPSNRQSKLLSPTDFKLDPTRRPNAIRLINGESLARNGSNSYIAKEKGLILVTDLPVYIKDKFNLHQESIGSGSEIEEFQETEPGTGFYDRSTPKTSFACRPLRPGCPTASGDYWRSATIIADSMTLLSGSFKDGFRSEGDYDLNNNTGVAVDVTDTRRQNRLKNGFGENNFVTNANWWDKANKNIPLTTVGSYTINGVTPIQRRIDDYPMYVMEICRKPLISDCGSGDWYVGFDIDGDGILSETQTTYPITGQPAVSLTEKYIKTYQLGQAIKAAKGSNPDTSETAYPNTLISSELSWFTSFTKPSTTYDKSIRARLGAGDTGGPGILNTGAVGTGDTGGHTLVPADQLYPRRIAFARNSSNNLVYPQGAGIYRPIGVGCPIDLLGTAYNNNGCSLTNFAQKGNNALWFRKSTSTTDPADLTKAIYGKDGDKPFFFYPPIDGDDADTNPDLDGQPQLVPVLQIHDVRLEVDSNLANLRTDGTAQDDFKDKWIQQATSGITTYNGTFVSGNSPSRSEETSAGLQNFVRFLENWGASTAKVSGSFIQLKRSAFATAPIGSIFRAKTSTTATTTNNLSLFDYSLDTYPTPNESGLLPFYSAPTRKWGFDVGLLSEQPDLFAQRFTLPPSGRPNEFFREVGRDDTWVKTLLCAGEASNQTGIPATGVTVTYARAVPNEYRPSGCPSSIPDDSV